MTTRAPAPEPLAVLVENHRRFLQFLERRVGSRAIAEDILQDALVKSLDRADALPEGEQVVAWFYRVLRNALVDHYRHGDAEQRALALASAESSDAEAPRDAELFDTICTCVSALLDTLKPEYAAAIRRIDLEDIPVAAYAREAGITPGNAGVRIHRARAALRRQVALSCSTCADHGCLDCSCGRPGTHRA